MLTKIKLERLNRGLRQTDIAALTGGIVPQHRFSLLERGVKPRPEEAQALAAALGIREAEIFQ